MVGRPAVGSMKLRVRGLPSPVDIYSISVASRLTTHGNRTLLCRLKDRELAQRLLHEGITVKALTNHPDRPDSFGGRVRRLP